jgi:hypothetical protein
MTTEREQYAIEYVESTEALERINYVPPARYITEAVDLLEADSYLEATGHRFSVKPVWRMIATAAMGLKKYDERKEAVG